MGQMPPFDTPEGRKAWLTAAAPTVGVIGALAALVAGTSLSAGARVGALLLAAIGTLLVGFAIAAGTWSEDEGRPIADRVLYVILATGVVCGGAALTLVVSWSPADSGSVSPEISEEAVEELEIVSATVFELGEDGARLDLRILNNLGRTVAVQGVTFQVVDVLSVTTTTTIDQDPDGPDSADPLAAMDELLQAGEIGSTAGNAGGTNSYSYAVAPFEWPVIAGDLINISEPFDLPSGVSEILEISLQASPEPDPGGQSDVPTVDPACNRKTVVPVESAVVRLTVETNEGELSWDEDLEVSRSLVTCRG